MRAKGKYLKGKIPQKHTLTTNKNREKKWKSSSAIQLSSDQ